MTAAQKLNLNRHALKRHFRIGQKIAKIADKLMPPDNVAESLEATSNYDLKAQGESSAHMHPCASRDEQFDKMLQSINIQLDAFKDDSIGIFCPTRDTLADLRKRFDGTKLKKKVCVHGVDDDSSFGGGKLIHVLTIHAATCGAPWTDTQAGGRTCHWCTPSRPRPPEASCVQARTLAFKPATR